MKIVYLGSYNPTEELTGPEKVAKRLFHTTNTLGYDVIFLEYYFKGCTNYNLANRLFGKEIICDRPKVIRGGLFYVIYFLVKSKPDIIHIVTHQRYIIIMLMLKFLFHSKIVVTLHGIVEYEIKRARKKISKYGRIKDLYLERLFMKKADLLVFLSENQLQIAKQYYHIPLKRIRILPNGIDGLFCVDRKNVNRKGKLKIVFYNGHSYEVKGAKVLCEVLSKLQKNDFELFILGEKLLVEIQNDIKVNYIPFLDSKKLSKLFADMDTYINASEYEPFSLISVEAMASGLIVIVSNRVGMQRYIHNNQNGFVFDYTKPEELRNILQQLIDGDIDRDFISQNSHEIFKELNWESVSKKYLEMYNS